MPYDEETTQKLKMRGTKDVNYFASRHSSIRFRHNETKEFMGFKLREKCNLGD